MMVTIGNLSPGLEYVISVITKLDTSGQRSPTSVLCTASPSLITGNQGNSAMYRNYRNIILSLIVTMLLLL